MDEVQPRRQREIRRGRGEGPAIRTEAQEEVGESPHCGGIHIFRLAGRYNAVAILRLPVERKSKGEYEASGAQVGLYER